jgi:drug/metabolite transporter superfamily protein YnfA
MKTTIGENIFATVLASVAAFFAGVVGFVGGAFLCWNLLRGEMTQWDLVVAPAAALILAVAAFVFVFGKIVNYGEPGSKGSEE